MQKELRPSSTRTDWDGLGGFRPLDVPLLFPRFVGLPTIRVSFGSMRKAVFVLGKMYGSYPVLSANPNDIPARLSRYFLPSGSRSRSMYTDLQGHTCR